MTPGNLGITSGVVALALRAQGVDRTTLRRVAALAGGLAAFAALGGILGVFLDVA